MIKKKTHIKKFTREKLTEGWSKQEIFNHLKQDLNTELQHDYKIIKNLATTIKNIPRIETRRKLRLLKTVLILLILAGGMLQVYLKSNVATFFGIFDLKLWLFLTIVLAANIFTILNLILIGPIIQYKVQAYIWLIILNMFTIATDIPGFQYMFLTYGWFFIAGVACRIFIGILAFLIYRKIPDRFSLTPETEKENTKKLWTVLFGN